MNLYFHEEIEIKVFWSKDLDASLWAALTRSGGSKYKVDFVAFVVVPSCNFDRLFLSQTHESVRSFYINVPLHTSVVVVDYLCKSSTRYTRAQNNVQVTHTRTAFNMRLRQQLNPSLNAFGVQLSVLVSLFFVILFHFFWVIFFSDFEQSETTFGWTSYFLQF